MKIYFLRPDESPLCAKDDYLLNAVKRELLTRRGVHEADGPEEADAIALHEEQSFKEWRYVKRLMKDPLVRPYAHKVYTINTDDAATGLLRGIYTCLPRRRFHPRLHGIVPYALYPNRAVLDRGTRPRTEAAYLGAWRGNTKSNRKLRLAFVASCRKSPAFLIETTTSWLDHSLEEQQRYVDVLLEGKFSLCPAGWAAVSFRIYESMALGVCPVIIADEFVPPLGPDWDDFAVRVREKDVTKLEPILEKIADTYRAKGDKARQAWERFFSPEKVDGYYADTLLACIRAGPATSSPNREIARWRSFMTYWANRWTLPQRLRIKIDGLAGR